MTTAEGFKLARQTYAEDEQALKSIEQHERFFHAAGDRATREARITAWAIRTEMESHNELSQAL